MKLIIGEEDIILDENLKIPEKITYKNINDPATWALNIVGYADVIIRQVKYGRIRSQHIVELTEEKNLANYIRMTIFIDYLAPHLQKIGQIGACLALASVHVTDGKCYIPHYILQQVMKVISVQYKGFVQNLEDDDENLIKLYRESKNVLNETIEVFNNRMQQNGYSPIGE